MTNLEGRVLLRRRVKMPPEGVWTDAQCSRRSPIDWEAGQHFSSDPRAIFDELRRASAGGAADYAGITYERIVRERRRVLAVPDRRPSRQSAPVP